MLYRVVENTPGYMPEVDEPPVFGFRAEAVDYALALAAELRELGYRVHRHGLQWFCEQNRRDIGRMIEVREVDA
jgi:hypothetical protein